MTTGQPRMRELQDPSRYTPGAPGITGRLTLLVLTAVSLLLTLPVFEPNSVGPLAWCAFVPWLVALVRASRSRWMYGVSFGFLLVFWLIHGRFLISVSSIAYVVYCSCLAVQSCLAPWVIRHLYRNRRLCLTIAFPVAWTAAELFRSLGLVSSTWIYLAHSQIRLPVVIQIADLIGSLGVTFVVAVVNGWLADLVINVGSILRPSPPARSQARGRGAPGKPETAPGRPGGAGSPIRRLMLSTAVALSVILFDVTYGIWRLRHVTTTEGPRVAVVQGDFPTSPGRPLDTSARVLQGAPPNDELDQLLRSTVAAREADKRLIYLGLISQAADLSPDLLVLPEAPWDMILNREYRDSPLAVRNRRLRLQHEELVRLASRHQTPILLTAKSLTPQPPGAYPQIISHNSALIYEPGRPEPGRRDKIGLMLLGEYLPFRGSERLHPLYRLLNDGPWNPWGRGGKEYIDDPGTEFSTFTVKARSDGKTYSFSTAICYEDAIPWLYRHFVVAPDGRKRVDFMVSMSNAGCFGHSIQQPQHLAVCAFRAIENRVWIARACNTGVSGFIDSAGKWYNLAGRPLTDPRQSVNGGSDRDPQAGGLDVRVAQARVDPTVTFYSRHGDWLAWTCLALSVASIIDSLVMRVRRVTRKSSSR
jgi:apolipoprotein N-acyltransferase